jgi:hypothetical protein
VQILLEIIKGILGFVSFSAPFKIQTRRQLYETACQGWCYDTGMNFCATDADNKYVHKFIVSAAASPTKIDGDTTYKSVHINRQA